MARLYPPITEEVLSAFCLSYNDKGEKTGASININFNLNKAVANAEIAGIALRLRTISTNQYVITENLANNPNTGESEGYALSYSLDDGKAIFAITAENNEEAVNKLKVGQYYKAQLAFIGLTGIIGYWSTVATIKCVARPSVTIANFTPDDANIFTNEILGEYIQDTSTGDSSEKVYSYQFQLFDNTNNLLDDTGVQLHNSSNDIKSNSSTDTYHCYRELSEGQSYYLVYTITTINGLCMSSPRYQIITADSIDPEDDITLLVSNGLENSVYDQGIPYGGFPKWQPWEEGLIKIQPDLNGRIEQTLNSTGENRAITGNFVVLRSSSKDNFSTWQEIRRFRLKNEKPYEKTLYDFTVEQGITYRYAIQQFNRQKFYSKKIYSYKRDSAGGVLKQDGLPIYNDITADFEDMFLYDGKRQLKIRFNPKVNSFKNDLQEQKIDTIGSKHPFIFRNGNVCYKEFPISGLISFQQDNIGLFITDEDYNQMKLSRFEDEDQIRGINKKITYQLVPKNDIIDCINNNIALYKIQTEYKDSVSIDGHENLLTNNKIAEQSYVLINSSVEAESYADPSSTVNVYKKVELTAGLVRTYYGNNTVLVNSTDYKTPVVYNKNDLTSENIMTERYFKLLVLDWLTDGKPKLFRSPTEGNYIVRLLNVSLTPKTELGRMIHEFSCTAYEIADFDYNALVDLGILTVEDIDETEQQWFSRKINEIFIANNKNENGYYNLELDNKKLSGFQATGFAPGDKISFMIEGDPNPLEVTIGTSGTYIYDGGKLIVKVSILPNHINEDFPRTALLSAEGYTSHPFDTMAAITTHTQMGQQFVGPMNDIFAQTYVSLDKNYSKSGLIKYYRSPNVYLIQAYNKVILTSQQYQRNKFYTYNSNTKVYSLATGAYSANTTYYQKELEGPKLRISEFLHLHAKKREVIPIFTPDQNLLSNTTYYVTPYGQGYIQSKSIVSSNTNKWINKYGNLTDAELSRAYTIDEIVSFMIDKCNKDIFCLFEVYVPKNDVANTPPYKSTDWISYTQVSKSTDAGANWCDKVSGIYDPWLYEQQVKWKGQAVDNIGMGWWPIRQLTNVPTIQKDYGNYDASFSLYYDNETINIDLNEIGEISFDNLKVPNKIVLGNGVVMEPIYRLQCIDYTIENENTKLKNLKNAYLRKKEEAAAKVLKYIAAENAKVRGTLLSKKYNLELEKIRDYENYQNVIEELTDSARTTQLNQLTTYFTEEKKLIQIIMSQIQGVDFTLLEEIGQEYEDDIGNRIFGVGTVIQSNYENYNNYFTTTGTNPRFENDGLTPKIAPLSTYANSKNAETVQTEVRNNILSYLYHINNSSNYNFSNTISNILIGYLTHKKDELDYLLNELGEKRYVSQYLALLDKKGKELFYSKLSTRIPNSGNGSFSQYTVGTNDMINKFMCKKWSNTSTGSTINNLQDYLITNSVWDEYFYLDKEKPLLSVDLIGATTSNPIYSVNNLDLYPGYYKQVVSATAGEEYSSNTIYYTRRTINGIVYYEQSEPQPTGIIPSNSSYYIWNKSHPSSGAPADRFAVSTASWFSTKYMKKNIIDALNNLNIAYKSGGGSITTRTQAYNSTYTPIKYAAGPPQVTLNDFKLGALYGSSGNYYIQKENHNLENIIDALYLSNPDITTTQIINEIKTRDIYTKLPNGIRDTINSYITEYLNEGYRDIYQKICACIAYRDTHVNELSDEQQTVISSMINSYVTNLSNFNKIITQTGATQNNFTQIQNYFITWNNTYTQVAQGNNFTEQKQLLDKYIADFNLAVQTENTICLEFLNYRNKYNSISNQYSPSDNIKIILQEQKQIYTDAIASLQQIDFILNLQLTKLQENVLFNGYLDFLKSYIEYKNSENITNKDKYLRLLEEAEAMAKVTADSSYSPYLQRVEIEKAWKTYLDALSSMYQTEIKERFG